MGYFRKGLKYLTDSDYRFDINDSMGLYKNMPDDEYLKRKFKVRLGRELNLDNPRSFNEKLQWLKLYNRKPEYTMMVDKYQVRNYIKDKLGEEYLIPLLGVWDDPDDIDFDALPDRFVLKCNHNSGLGMCICKDKSKLDIEKVKKELRKGLKQDYYISRREWPYKNVTRKIICEKYMEEEPGKGLKDYKLYCFNGRAEILLVVADRFSDTETKAAYFDRNGNTLPIKWGFEPIENMEVPECFDEMFRLAEILSADLPHARIDFYYINGRIYFGEITFFDGSGFDKIEPIEWDYKIGDMLELPDICE